MPSLNIVTLIGNLTRDPELKHTPKGTAVCQVSLAVNHKYTTGDGEKREEVNFIDCEMWGRTAEIVQEYCKKGNPLAVTGRLKQETWDDKTTGAKRSKIKVIVGEMTLLGGGQGRQPKDEDDPRASRAARPPASAPKPPPDADLDGPMDDIPF